MHSQTTNTSTFWVIIPAAGFGTRLNAANPKQFLTINGHYVLEHSIAPFTRLTSISRIYVAIQPAYQAYMEHLYQYSTVETIIGGEERAVSVYNALLGMESASEQDWVLVHDAVRPCLTSEDICKLINNVADHPVGGLLATPLNNTVKKADLTEHVSQTVNRQYLWSAVTPQMFRYGLLKKAMETALSKQYYVTDESSAIECLGYQPLLVPGRRDNIKVTVPDDLQLASTFLSQRSNSEHSSPTQSMFLTH